MNTTTGTTNWIQQKSPVIILLFLFSGMLFSQCKSHQNQEEESIVSRSDVKLTQAVLMDVDLNETFTGTTRYLQNGTIRAPFSGIITEVNIGLNQKFTPKQELFQLQARESAVLESSSLASGLKPMSNQSITSASSGIVSVLFVRKGDFVQEGDVLANFIDQNSLRVLLSVPLENSNLVHKGLSCKLLLPAGTTQDGSIESVAPAANETDQTLTLIVKISKPIDLVENMQLKVRVKTGTITNGIFLPANAIYGNEELSRFWVLKLVNDSLAVQLPIEKGAENDGLIQIVRPEIQVNELFISSGGYGLPDSSLVNILPNE
ncbi:MAG: efflux RND transporter periplasmic adaptor subunit [Prolixibacteraceae bacterium]